MGEAVHFESTRMGRNLVVESVGGAQWNVAPVEDGLGRLGR